MVEKLHFRCNRRNVNYTSSPPCSELILSFSFPDAVPALTRVPRWAYHDPTVDGVRSTRFPLSLLNRFSSHPQSDSWDNLVAEYIGGAYLYQRITSFMYYVLYYWALSQVCPKLQAVPPMSRARLAVLRPEHLRVRRHRPRVARMLALSRGVSSGVSLGWP